MTTTMQTAREHPGRTAGAPLLIDVRNESEHRAAHLPGARLVPLPLLPALIGEVVPDRDTPVVVFCAAGGRAAMACSLLAGMGYTQVANGGSLDAVAGGLGQAVHRGG